METIFMNTENRNNNEPHRIRLSLADKLNLKDPSKNMALASLSIYYTFITHETLTDNPPIQIYHNKTKTRIVFKIKTGYKLELLSSETMKLFGSTKKRC